MLEEVLVRDDLLKFIIFTLIWISLSCQHECHLLQCGLVFALTHDLANEVHIVHLLGNSKGIWILFELSEDIMGCLKCSLHLLSISSVIRTREKIVANSRIVVLVREFNDFGKFFHLNQEIHSLWLLIMVDELWYDLIN